MKFCKSKASELKWLSDFYRECGYGGKVDGIDDVYYMIEENTIAGVVRIAYEDGTFVLRGMQVLPKLRGKHIGRKLLGYVEKQLIKINEPCYCAPMNICSSSMLKLVSYQPIHQLHRSSYTNG